MNPVHVYDPAFLLNRSPYVQIGLHPYRAAQFFVGILRQQHSRRLSLGCYLQGLGFGRQSPTMERRAAELE
jgi:hypothetical protein